MAFFKNFQELHGAFQANTKFLIFNGFLQKKFQWLMKSGSKAPTSAASSVLFGAWREEHTVLSSIL